MEIRHAQGDILQNVENLFFTEKPVSFVEVVEKTAFIHELCNHAVLVVVNTHSHVKDDARVEKFVDDLHLFDEVTDMSVPEALLLQVFLDSHRLAKPPSFENLAVASSPDGPRDGDLLLGNEESQLDSFFLQMILNLG
jgi:hypothetical protein